MATKHPSHKYSKTFAPPSPQTTFTILLDGKKTATITVGGQVQPQVISQAAPPVTTATIVPDEFNWHWFTYKTHLETLSFCANILLVIVAGFALRAARKQAEHAYLARLADVYLEISKSVDNLSKHFKVIDECTQHFQCTGIESEQGTIMQVISLGVTYAQHQDVENSIDTVLSVIEDVGLLCRKGYVRRQDIFDIMGGIIQFNIERCLLYISHLRRDSGRRTYYANTLWLYKQVCRSQRFKVGSYGIAPPNWRRFFSWRF